MSIKRCADCHEPVGGSPVCDSCAGLRCESVAGAAEERLNRIINEQYGEIARLRTHIIAMATGRAPEPAPPNPSEASR